MREHDQELGGIRLHFLDWGEDNNEVALLIHGLTASSHEWVKLASRLMDAGLRAVAPDLRGRGLSSKPSHGYGIPFHAVDLLSLIDRLYLKKVSIVGHSLGAAIGLYFSALFPDRVSKFVLVDAGVRLPSDTVQAISASVNRVGQVYPSIDAYLEMCRNIPYFTWNEFWEQYFRYDAEVRSDGTVSSKMPRSALLEEISVNTAINADLLLPLIKAPTLIVRATEGTLGGEKGLLLTREEANRLSSLIKSSEVKSIPKTNHYSIVTSEEFETAVTEFLHR